MDVVELKHEECSVMKAVIFAFDGPYLVVDPFEFTARDIVPAAIEAAHPISPQGFWLRQVE